MGARKLPGALFLAAFFLRQGEAPPEPGTTRRRGSFGASPYKEPAFSLAQPKCREIKGLGTGQIKERRPF
jgi:hypothetical protein